MDKAPALVAATEAGDSAKLQAVLKSVSSRLTSMGPIIVDSIKLAIIHRHELCADLLIEAAGAADCSLEEALPVAAKHASPELCQRMLDTESLDTESSMVQHALVRAAAAGRAAVLLAFLRRGVSPGIEGGLALRAAAASGAEDVVAILLRDPRIDAAARDNGALVAAAAAGHGGVVAQLLAKAHRGVTPLAQKGAAVVLAAQRGHNSVVDQLLGSVPRDDIPDGQLLALHECLWEACRGGEGGLVRVVLKHPRAQPAARNNLAIRTAAAMHNTPLVKLLLASPQVAPSAGGQLPLTHACFVGDKGLVAALLKDPRLVVRPGDAEQGHARLWQRWDERDATRSARVQEPQRAGDCVARAQLADATVLEKTADSDSSLEMGLAVLVTGRLLLSSVDDAEGSRLWPTQGLDMFGCHKDDMSLAAPVRAAAAGNHADIITMLHRRELYERVTQASARAEAAEAEEEDAQVQAAMREFDQWAEEARLQAAAEEALRSAGSHLPGRPTVAVPGGGSVDLGALLAGTRSPAQARRRASGVASSTAPTAKDRRAMERSVRQSIAAKRRPSRRLSVLQQDSILQAASIGLQRSTGR